MVKTRTLVISLGMAALWVARAGAEVEPRVVALGKSATAFVQVTFQDQGASGSAFCVDRCGDGSGLFVTNAHVVTNDRGQEGTVHLVVDIGLETQRVLPARILRRDDALDLALLQVQRGAGLKALTLGRDADLTLLSEVVTFGYPFGAATAVGRSEFPDITVLTSRITSFQRDRGRLSAIQFDNQVNPGNSGGPVLDASGKIVGVVRATVRGASLNLAIPVGRLAEFLKAPGLVFDPPEFSYEDRAAPVTWTIRVRPSEDELSLPDGLSVALTLETDAGAPRTILADRLQEGVYRATLVPMPRDPDWIFVMKAWYDGSEPYKHFTLKVSDPDVRGGLGTFRSAVLRSLLRGRSPRAAGLAAGAAAEPDLRLPKVTVKSGEKTSQFDLNEAQRISVERFEQPPTATVVARVEARRGADVLATVRRRTRFELPKAQSSDPFQYYEEKQLMFTPCPATPNRSLHVPLDNGHLSVGGVLDVDGVPRGSGRSIRPPTRSIPPARLTPDAKDEPLVVKLPGQVSDVAVGGGGRYLVLTMEARRQVAVFDVNRAEVVKTIPLPGANALVAAGATKILILFPLERLVQRWDLETLRRDGPTCASPIDARVHAIVLGSDSDGPALAFWSEVSASNSGITQYQYSFIDVDSLTVPAAGLVSSILWADLSTSGGSFDPKSTGERSPLRASAGGGLFECGTRSVRVLGRVLEVGPETNNSPVRPKVPGTDSRTLFSSLSYRVGVGFNEVGPIDPLRSLSPEVAVQCCDPAYYLSFLPPRTEPVWVKVRAGLSKKLEPLTATVHAADGLPLFTFYGLEEMAGAAPPVQPTNDLTIEKRYHFVPAARMLITIPDENDRLVLRQVDIQAATDRAGGSCLVIVSTPLVRAEAGESLAHQIEVRSTAGGVAYAIRSGPDGATVSADGKLTWPVPKALRGEDVSAVVGVRDASGQERVQDLLIRVR